MSMWTVATQHLSWFLCRLLAVKCTEVFSDNPCFLFHVYDTLFQRVAYDFETKNMCLNENPRYVVVSGVVVRIISGAVGRMVSRVVGWYKTTCFISSE